MRWFRGFRRIPEEFFYGQSETEAKEKLAQLQRETEQEFGEEYTALKDEEQDLARTILELHSFFQKKDNFFRYPTRNNLEELKTAVLNLEREIERVKRKNIKFEHLLRLCGLNISSMKSLIGKIG